MTSSRHGAVNPLNYVPLMAAVVPLLTGAQFGVGLLVVTMVGRRRRVSKG